MRKFFENKISSDDRIDLLEESNNNEIGVLLLLERDEGVAEIGIWLHPYHGNDYGTEAGKLIIDYPFDELRYEKIFVRTYEDNEVSKKLGFKQEGTKKADIHRRRVQRRISIRSIKTGMEKRLITTDLKFIIP